MLDDNFLTTTELGEKINTPPATLRYWRHIGDGPRSVKLGRRVLYRASDVEAWLAAQYEEQARTHQGTSEQWLATERTRQGSGAA